MAWYALLFAARAGLDYCVRSFPLALQVYYQQADLFSAPLYLPLLIRPGSVRYFKSKDASAASAQSLDSYHFLIECEGNIMPGTGKVRQFHVQ